MKITVETGRWAARYMPDEIATLELPEGATVQDAIDAAGLPADEAGLVAVDGAAVARDYVLPDGGTVKIYAAIIGG